MELSGHRGELQQLEFIQSHQTTPCIPQNEEACRIMGALGQQPKNMFAPSNKSRKAAKESEVCETLYVLDPKLMPIMKTHHDIPAPSSPILPLCGPVRVKVEVKDNQQPTPK